MISFLVAVFVLAWIIKFFSFRVFKIIIIIGIIFIILNFIISHFNDFINRCRSDYDENINVYSISDKYDLKSKGSKKNQILSYNFNYADNNLTKFESGQRCKNANYATDNLSISCPFE